MDIKAFAIGVTVLLAAMPALGKDIYKCEVDGVIKYQEEKCDETSVPVQLKELAAPLGTFDAKTIEGQSERTQETAINERIARHQKRIRNYRRKMESDLNALQSMNSKTSKHHKSTPRNSVINQEQSNSLNRIATNVGKESIPEQMNAVINRYKVLIEAEQFQINLLRGELAANQNSTDKK